VWIFSSLEVDTGFLRIGVHTHNADAITMFSVIAVPWPVYVKHLAQEELALLLVCIRALQRVGRVQSPGRNTFRVA
jgi:hypothetical protein